MLRGNELKDMQGWGRGRAGCRSVLEKFLVHQMNAVSRWARDEARYSKGRVDAEGKSTYTDSEINGSEKKLCVCHPHLTPLSLLFYPLFLTSFLSFLPVALPLHVHSKSTISHLIRQAQKWEGIGGVLSMFLKGENSRISNTFLHRLQTHTRKW